MRNYLLLLIVMFGLFSANAETWVPLGKGYYEDPIWLWNNSNPVGGEVNVEESVENPGSYRFKHLLSSTTPEYMYVNCENPNQVYVSDYTSTMNDGSTATVSQICAENGWDANYYGTLSENTVTIPATYFGAIRSNENVWYRGEDNRSFYFRLPSGGSSDVASGLYFGITAFNYKPNFLDIQLIDGSNKQKYHEFVNSRTLDDYTYLYYSVDKAIDKLAYGKYPNDLSSVALITFTDGNDDGSLELAPNTSWTDVDYQQYVKNKISSTAIQKNKLEAFSIGLKGIDIGDYNYDLFKSNLKALASEDNNASEVSNMAEVERTLNDIIDRLQTSWLNKKVQVRINMRGTGDKVRFTLDKSRSEMNNNPENSDLWIEGVFNREDISLNDIVYHGFTSTSGLKVKAETVTVNGRTKYQFTFENLRDANDNPLETGEINFWHKNSSTPAWQPHTEFGGEGDVNTETEYASAAIMLVMDCSSSLGDTDFSKLKDVVNSLIERLANKDSGVKMTLDDNNSDAPVEYFNLQGVKVASPTHGIYIRRQGNKATKVLIK